MLYIVPCKITDMATANSNNNSSTPAVKEVEMGEATKPTEPTPQELNAILLSDLKKNVTLLEKSVTTKESRLAYRALRTWGNIRKRLVPEVLRDIVQQVFVAEDDASHKQKLLSYLSKFETSSSSMETESTGKQRGPAIPEVEVYLKLLVLVFLIDKKHYKEATECAAELVDRLQSNNIRRVLDLLSAKAYFYYARSFELTNRLEEIRSTLLSAYRTAALRHNEESQATLLNALLRNYLHYNLYDRADKLVSKVTVREDTMSSNQYARFLFYQGVIKSIQLEYSEAHKCLLGAIRKAPQNAAKGFRIQAHKWACIVQLLMGEIPERSIFRQADLKQALLPYLQLTQSVRVGDLNTFHEVVKKHQKSFVSDKTYSLIQRLHNNVIKTGLRKINLAYSRISFEDVCKKLHLNSADDVEFIVAKAIRDGVINATINHEGRYIQSTENMDIYSTQEPLGAFHKRIKFCLKTHNEAIKAMRFPPDAHKPNVVESAKERREREQEIAKNLAEEEEDGF